MLLALVDLADAFDRALVHIDASPDSIAAGLHGMQRRLDSLLEAEGVKPFGSLGQVFDPTRHEAVATVRALGWTLIASPRCSASSRGCVDSS